MTQELKKWNFSTVGTDVKYFPDSYKIYISLLSGDNSKKVNNCYSQNPEKNNINLWCAFLTAMNGEGVEGVIIDVESSSKAGKIVTSTSTTTVNEVILRNLLKNNGKKVLVGLFRGSCNSTIKGKRGIASFLNLFGDKNLNCTPQEAEAQIAYFPRYYFEQFYKTIRDSGAAGDVLEKIKKQLFVKYTEGNRLDYVFYYGSVKSSEDGSTTFRSGQGKMLRQPYGITDPRGSCEIIEGEWGRNVQQNGETYYDSNYVSGATLYRVSNSEQGEVEGVAVGGEWNNGRYYGGACLSSSLNFGSGVEFNYTGRLVEKLSRPVAGIISFENAEKVVDSLVVRSFTSPWDKDKEHLKNNNDNGIHIMVGDMSGPPKYVYVGGFDGNTFVHKGYGIILFVSGGFSYMYIGSIELSDYKYGVLYKISSSIFELEGIESGHPSAESSDKVCGANSIESFWGKFSSVEITAESRPFAEVDYKDKSGSAGVETDVRTASLCCKEALTNYSKIYESYSSTFSEASNLGLTIAQQTVGEQYRKVWVHKFSEYRKIFEQSFGGVDKYIGFIRRCEKPGSGKNFNLVLPDISSSASPVVSSFGQPSFAQSTATPQLSLAQPSFSQPQSSLATPQLSLAQPSLSQPSLAESPATPQPTEPKWKNILASHRDTSLYFGPKSSGSSLAQPIPSSTPPVKKPWAELLKSKNDPSSPFFIPGSQSQRPVLSRANSASPSGFTSPSPLGNVSSLHMSSSSQQADLLQQQKQLLNLEQELQRQLQPQPQGQTSSMLATQEFAKLVQDLITSNNDERRNLQEQYKLLELINLLKSKESQMSEFSPTTQGEIKRLRDEIKSQKEASEQMKKLKEQHKKELKEQKEIISDLKLDKSNSELLRKIESLEKLVSSATMGSPAFGSPAVSMVSPAFGSPAVSMGSPAVTMASPAVSMGSPAVSMGSPAVSMGSPAVSMGAPAFGSFAALPGAASSDTLNQNATMDSQQQQQQEQQQEQQQQEQQQDEPKILFLSKCILGGSGESGFIALGQQFLGYGDSEEKAKKRAITGKYEKEDQGKIPADYYVIDIINDEVGTQLKLSDKFFDKKNLIIIGYQKHAIPGVRDAGKPKNLICDFSSNGSAVELAKLIKQIRDENSKKVQSEEEMVSMKEKLTKYLNELTEYNRLLSMLRDAANDTNSEEVINIVVSTSFKQLIGNINETIGKLNALIPGLSLSTSSTTENYVSSTGSDVEKIIIRASIYIEGITSAIRNLPGDGKNAPLIDIVKKIAEKISSQVTKSAEAKAAAVAPLVAAPLEVSPAAPEVAAPAPLVSEVAPLAASEVAPLAVVEVASSKKRGPPPMNPSQQKAKALLQKKLDEVIYCRVDEWYKRCTIVENKLNNFISRLNAGSTSIPTDAELTGVVTDVKELLDNADIFKTAIIEVITKLPVSERADNAPLIKVAKLLVEEIQQHDKEYKEQSVDSTTTDMAALVEEANKLNKDTENVVKLADTLKEFYDTGSSSANKDNLKKAATCYTDMKSIVERIDKVYADAQKILGNVSVFDKVARSAAESSVNAVGVLKIQIYIAAAKSLATLVTNMAKSAGGAGGAADVAIAAGNEVNGGVIVTGKETTTPITVEGKFKELKEKFDKAVTAGDTIYEGQFDTSECYSTSAKYLDNATTMVSSIKGKKDAVVDIVSSPLQIAKDAVNLWDKERETLHKKRKMIVTFKDPLQKLQTYLDNVTTEFGKIVALQEEAAELLKQLETAQTAGIKAFDEYDEVVSSGPSTGLDDAKAKANIAYGKVAGIKKAIIEKISSAKTIADKIFNGAKFQFVKTRAEEESGKLDLSTNITVKNATEKIEELKTKRNASYKISNIDEIKRQSTELKTKMGEMKSLVDVISKLGEQVEVVNAQVGNTKNTDMLGSGDATLNEIKRLSNDSQGNLREMDGPKNLANVVLEEIKVLAGNIGSLFNDLEKHPSLSFNSEKKVLEELVKTSTASLEQATKDVASIAKYHEAATEAQGRTADIARLYGEIKGKYDGALKLVADFDIDEKLTQQEQIRTGTVAKVADFSSKAQTAYDVVMAFTAGTVLTHDEMHTIDQKYKEVGECKNELAGMQADNSGKEVEFGESVQSEVLSKLETTILEIDGISKSVSFYANLDKYCKEVFKILDEIKRHSEEQIKNNKEESIELTGTIQGGINKVQELDDDMKKHIDGLKVQHKTNTCKTVGSEFTFSSDKLSGKSAKITISSDDKTAEQSEGSGKCFWLTTNQGIPTDCGTTVTWAMQILSPNNLDETLMGIGLDGFNPFAKGSGSGALDCDVIQGFWGFSGTNNYTNGVGTPDKKMFTESDVVFFNLSPEAPLGGSGGGNKKFKLHMTVVNSSSKNNFHKVLDVEVPSDTEFLYPVVRFRSNGHKYGFVNVTDNLKELKLSFTAAALKDYGFTAELLYNAGFTIEELDIANFKGTEMKDLVTEHIRDISIDILINSVSINHLKNSFGFTAKELKDIGFNAAQLKKGGLSADDLIGAGFTESDILPLFPSSGGRGLSAARKIHMTRRTRLRLKKSRVITRRPKSSHLRHVSNASVGSTRKKQITNGSGKAISTRKI